MAVPTSVQIDGAGVVVDSFGNDLTIDTAQVRASALSTLSPGDIYQYIKALSLVSVSMTDNYTTLVANGANYTTINNSSVFCRPSYECHLFFETQFIIDAASTAGPASTLSFTIQTWLNQYHVLISPTGIANDWTINLPWVSNSEYTLPITVKGGIFNCELRKAPAYHLIDFRYNMPTLGAGWSQVQVKPRMTAVYAIPSSQISFQSI